MLLADIAKLLRTLAMDSATQCSKAIEAKLSPTERNNLGMNFGANCVVIQNLSSNSGSFSLGFVGKILVIPLGFI